MKHSKFTQADLDKLVPAVLFQEQSEQDRQAEPKQREFEKNGNGFSALRNNRTPHPTTPTEAEAQCENYLAVRDKNKEIPF